MSNNETIFPIKIGRSINNPEFRVNEQSGTAMPEKPVIFIQVETQNCTRLESLIHCFFILKNRKKENSVGNEWFDSNEEEVENLLKYLINNDLDLNIEKFNNVI